MKHSYDSDAPTVAPLDNVYVETAIAAVADMIRGKSQDYANGSDSMFANFEETGALVGLDPAHVAIVQVGIKASRIRHIEKDDYIPANESSSDSYLDLASYAILAFAMYMKRMS